MHQVLRWPKKLEAVDSQDVFPTYEFSRSQQIISKYCELINSQPREEAVQQFLQDNPIFWSFLSAQQIIHKPRMLTKYVADFAVLSSNRILWIVEIEKPQTILITQAGKRSSEFESGLQQIRDWNDVVNEHRSTLLAELGIKSDSVHEIRFILIAGLAQQTSPKGMIQLRRQAPAEAEFYTFDELASYLHMTAAAFARL